MKYIREYNGYGEYYYEISRSEYYSFYDVGEDEDGYIISHIVSFTVDEVKKMVNMFRGYRFILRDFNSGEVIISSDDISFNKLVFPYTNRMKYFRLFIGGDYINIDSLGDEWYLVSLKSNFYKCDQLDGVKKLIEDKVLFKETNI